MGSTKITASVHSEVDRTAQSMSIEDDMLKKKKKKMNASNFEIQSSVTEAAAAKAVKTTVAVTRCKTR